MKCLREYIDLDIILEDIYLDESLGLGKFDVHASEIMEELLTFKLTLLGENFIQYCLSCRTSPSWNECTLHSQAITIGILKYILYVLCISSK